MPVTRVTDPTGAAARRRTRAAAAALATLVLAGCGSGGGIPTSASEKDFCAAADGFAKATRFDQGLKAADRLRDTGTPKGINTEARSGFELVVDLVTESKDKADLEKRYAALTDKQKRSVTALDAFITRTC
jgi:hypothetical protein